MRTIRYKVLPPINPFGDPVPHTHGSLMELFFAVPYMLHGGVIPPLPVVNEVLLSGKVDSGMSGGCQWKPFQIEPEEYDELVLELLTLPDKTFSVIEPPKRVETYKDWKRWTLDQQRF